MTRWLSRAPAWTFSAWCVVAAFSTYFAMYAFRKPFTAGKFAAHVTLFGGLELDEKTLFILAQAIGYATSKFAGIKVISELSAARRAFAIFLAIATAELGLAVFALVPAPWCAIGLVVNGLPLGMVWGLVFGFLEGRRVSDVLGAGLCASFIVGSGAVKSVGKALLDAGVAERWMPALTGALFAPVMAGTVWMLAVIPKPTAEDEAARTRRAPMDGPARRAFLAKYAPGLAALVLGYMVLTALRDFRDNFARELWDALGFGETPSILATAELPVAFGALLPVVLVMLVKDNRRALGVMHGVLVAGAVLAGGSTLLFQAGAIGPVTWMISVGVGLYVAYVPFNCVLFDRLIAATGTVGTAGFLIYVSDASGYLGSTGLLMAKSLGKPKLPWLAFYEGFAEVGSAICVALFVLAWLYFARKPRAAALHAAEALAPT
ncbi:MAG: DUF5690 family protein [Polyangiaceae bacterium]